MKEKRALMTTGSIPRLILSLSLPNMLGLLVVSAYSLADSFFVAGIGEEATAAVGLTFSLHVLMQAVGYTLGMGAGTLLSRALGRGDGEEARGYARTAILLSLAIGMGITVLGLPLRIPLLRLLGASPSLLPTAEEYVTPLLLSAPMMCGTFVISQLLRAEGRAVPAMLGLALGSLSNIALDPLLISVAGLGVRGASIATLISQSAALALLTLLFLRGKKPRAGRVGEKMLSSTGKILWMGLPSLLRQGLSGVATVLLTRSAAMLGGDGAVSALSLVARLFLLAFSICLGIGQGMLPVVGYNAGAEKPRRMRAAYLFSIGASTLAMLLVSLPLYFSAPQILSLFGAPRASLSIGVTALRAQALALSLHGTITCTILFLQAVGKSASASLLAAARQGIFFLPLILLLPSRWGLVGLALTQPLSDCLTWLLALPLVWVSLRFVRKKAT